MKKVLFLLVISFLGGFLNASSLYEKLINKETISVGTEGITPLSLTTIKRASSPAMMWKWLGSWLKSLA